MFARRNFLASAIGLTAVSVAPMAWAQEAAAPAPAVEIPDMMLGNPDAPVTVIEYASFTCPHCANFSETVFKDLKRDYIDTGKIKYIHREVFFDRYGLWATMVARCGGEMRYFGIADRLYATQKDWIDTKNPANIADNLRKIGLSSGMDAAQLDACLQDNAQAQALVNWYSENAKRDEINSTPSFLINGEKYSNMDYAELSKILDEKLGG